MNKVNPTKLLYLDIETVPQYPHYLDLPADVKKHWDKKATFIKRGDESELSAYKRAGIYAEFGKIVCISIGAYHTIEKEKKLRIKSFYGDDEIKILSDFKETIEKLEKKEPVILCAHNGKEFDFPYICRRMLVNKISLPNTLQFAGKKPWEILHVDTMEMWRFGDYKNYTSLDLLTSIFKIPSPKTNMDGSQVADYFYNKKDVKSIKKYCEQDVLAIAQVMLAYSTNNILTHDEVEFVD